MSKKFAFIIAKRFAAKGFAATCFAAMCFAVACGGGDGFSTGLPPSKSLGDLTPTEASKICSATVDFVAAKAKASRCLLDALSTSLSRAKTQDEARMMCQQSNSDCLKKQDGAAAGGGAGSGSGAAPVNCLAPPATCKATVGEYEGCLNDNAAAYDMFQSALPTCETLTLPPKFTPSATGGIQTPASCKALQAKCPGVSIGGPGTGSGS